MDIIIHLGAHRLIYAKAKIVGREDTLFIKKLAVNNFRNYQHAELLFEPRPVVLYGTNGAGKTNLLEAISLFAVGTGMRGAKLKDIGNRPSSSLSESCVSGWGVQAILDDETTLATGYEGLRRICKIQGEPVRATKFHEYLCIIYVTPEMDHIFMAASSDRRHFADKLIESYNPEHAANVSSYEKAMHQRLTLLKQASTPDWIGSLEKIMAKQNMKIAKARGDLMQRLMVGQANHVPMFPKFVCKMAGAVEDALAERTEKGSEEGSESEFLEKLAKNRAMDRAAGMTTFGCHRSDFEVVHRGKARLARECSTGEQKITLVSVILSFVYQKIESLDGRHLVLLLDDVIARLDSLHCAVLFDQVAHLGTAGMASTFFSGTSLEAFRSMPGAQFFDINSTSVRGA